ncbi:acetyl-CoA carboxylase biotin carboxyl carrier protein [Salsuginibacillus kocurii]|uniref:acetyl-CoA carboxylase biotin carboxyl carrier protein n=1 Tax=Salsuginibacillus kocurii TaxID=427078 RepID=UPI0003721C0D|nr:acetyl-CoA carboxylase biotin carboxyl carrier protein [Salsuginibacillus kocurii]
MFKMNEIKELIRAVDRSGIGELEIKGENREKLTIRKESAVGGGRVTEPVAEQSVPSPPPAVVKEDVVSKEQEVPTETTKPEESTDNANLHKITSPMVGTFYRSPSPDAEAYVKEGDRITSDSVVCIVEAMKLMNELEAEVTGEIVEILVDNGELVEYGQPLFTVKTQD